MNAIIRVSKTSMGKYLSVQWDDIFDVTFTPDKINYANIVSTCIKSLISDDSMQAIINNYLLDPEKEDTLEEFNKMQEVRSKCKVLAKRCMAAVASTEDYYEEEINL